MITKRRLLATSGAALLLSAGLATAQEFTFSIHHFLSPRAAAHTQLIVPWAAAIEEASEGRIKFEIFPAMALGGAPPELYSQARDGFADVVWTLPGYTAGAFPRSEVFELPNVHGGDAVATNLAIQELFDEVAEDFSDVQPLLLHVHSGNALHINGDPVEEVADFAGLKIRSPSRTGAWMLEELGAEPVGMPVPALPQALSQNNVDAGLVPFEIAIPLKLAELTDASVQLSDGDRFGTATFLLAMNQDSYNSLPADLQQIVDEASGAALAAVMGEVWNRIEPVGIQIAEDAGNSVTELSPEVTAELQGRFEAVSDRWLSETGDVGFDNAALLQAAKDAVARNAN